MARFSDIIVRPRNLRWEVAIMGVVRPMIDWFATKERALEHAFEHAAEVEAAAVIVEDVDGNVAAKLPVMRERRTA